ncbi:hypothetical protein IRZ59_16025 [Pseudomonas guariconensis]|uniref:hypothetical protein n=1 Tax=Pseudomonas guariconensis TaxID=1288410 RepID=UPI0018A8EE1C|nr:hypothetical protein [Pseudomonas guariconensis]MBF8731945.1 hypothetical protein [Pseudomonas guariconensis]
MSMKETIAQLVGVLKFDVDSRGMTRFNQMMQSANKKLTALGREYEQLSKAMAKGLKLKIDTTAIDKAKAKLDKSLKRQSQAETVLSNQQRQTFTQELTQQKLKFAGTKAQATLDNAHLQSKKEAAVVAAKAAAMQAKAQGVSKAQLATQNALTASLARQAKLEAIVQKTRTATQRASDQHLLTMGKLRRLQYQINQGQQLAQQRAQQHAAKLAAQQQTAANKAQNASQSAQRFQWAQQRHAAWQARQNAPAPRVGMFGGMSPMMGLGGLGALGAGIAGLTLAIKAMDARIEARKSNVIDAERFDAAFVGLGKTDETRKFWRDTFLKLSNESGAEISNETAEDFRTFVGMQQAFGKTTDQIIKEYQLRQKAFTVAGLTKDSSRELNRQLNQVSTDGLGDKSDWNVISERMPMIVPYVTRAFGEEEKIKDPVKAVAAFNKRMKKGGGVKMDWITKGMETMVAENQAIFQQKRNSVGFAKQLQDNQQFLNAVGINSTQELNSVIRENIQAHRELDEALQPAKQKLRDFDTALTQAQTGLIRFVIGLNPDGSKKSSEQLSQELADAGSEGGINFGAIAPSQPPAPVRNSDSDPVDRFWRWMLGVKPKPKDDNPILGAIPEMNLDTSQISKGIPDFTTLATKLQSLEGLKQMQDSMATSAQAAQASLTSTINAPITVEGANVNVTINGSATEQDRQEMMNFINTELDKHQRQVPGIAQKALTDMIGQARAQQAERR